MLGLGAWIHVFLKAIFLRKLFEAMICNHYCHYPLSFGYKKQFFMCVYIHIFNRHEDMGLVSLWTMRNEANNMFVEHASQVSQVYSLQHKCIIWATRMLVICSQSRGHSTRVIHLHQFLSRPKRPKDGEFGWIWGISVFSRFYNVFYIRLVCNWKEDNMNEPKKTGKHPICPASSRFAGEVLEFL